MRSRTRVLTAVGVVVAVGIGATVWAVTSSGGPPASPLNATAAPSCPGSAGPCSAAGTVRWMLSPAGGYDLDGSTGTVAPQLSKALTLQLIGGGSADSDAEPEPAATLADGMLVYQQGGLVEGIDPATGTIRWRTELTRRGTLLNVIGSPPAADGSQVAVTATPGPQSQTRVWELAVGTGAVEASIPLGAGSTVITPAADGVVVSLSDGDVEHLGWASGAASWRASFPSVQTSASPSLIGSVLYDISRTGRQIERIDLQTGRVLPALPLPAGLASSSSSPVSVRTVMWSQSAAEGQGSDVLLASNATTIARLNPATGQAEWVIRGQYTDLNLSADASSPLSGYAVAEVLGGSFRITRLNLATGQQIWTAPLSLSRLNDYLNNVFLEEQNLSGMVYKSLIVTESPQSSGSATSGSATSAYARLEGIDPRTGRIAWTGPLMSNDMEVLAWTQAGPPVIIVEACAPAGTHAGSQDFDSTTLSGTCTAPRIFAVNA